MKKKLLARSYYFIATVLFMHISGSSAGQVQLPVKINDTAITDLMQSPLNSPAWATTPNAIVTPDFSSRGDARAAAEARGKFKIWLEYGDGGFTTSDNSVRKSGTARYPAQLMVQPLYDTSKGKDGTITRSMLNTRTSGAARLSDNDNPLLNSGRSIQLTPSSAGIVLGEPLALAVTYKPQASKKVFTANMPSIKYYAVIYYNNNRFDVFNTLSKNAVTAFNYSKGNTLNNVRIFANQSLPDATPALPAMPAGYRDSFVVELATEQAVDGVRERNFFVTLKATGDTTVLQQGQYSSIMVKMVGVQDGVPTVIDSDTLFNMSLERAFDPNHITVTPACFLLPREGKLLTYRVEFQNLGKGDADQVKIAVKRPEGVDPASFTIVSVNYAGNNVSIVNNTGNDPKVMFKHVYVATSNTDTFYFASAGDPGVLLRGTNVSADALTNPLTMGEIVFTVKTTANIKDRMECSANILFHSKGFEATDWEPPVPTNTALTVVKEKACECDNTCIKDCYKLLGLCWYWWVLILLVIIILIWLLRRRR